MSAYNSSADHFRGCFGLASPYAGLMQADAYAGFSKLYHANRKEGPIVEAACCRTQAEAEHALARAGRILETPGVTLNREKTRIVHIAHGFESLGFKIQRGKARYKLTRDRTKSKLNRQNLYAIPTQKSVDRFKDQIRALTMRRIPLRLGELIETINPIIRGWGNYYCRSHVRKRFHQLDGWIIRRLWSHHTKRWRNAAVDLLRSYQGVLLGLLRGTARRACLIQIVCISAETIPGKSLLGRDIMDDPKISCTPMAIPAALPIGIGSCY